MYRPSWVTLRKIRRVCTLALLGLAMSAQAQVKVGDDVSMTLNGNLAFGYSGDYGNTGSGHGLFGSGAGQLSGYFYQPTFLSFNVRPFYNRNQDNSSFTSILRETGVDTSADIFSGSHFPGAVAFSKSFSSGSQFGIPGSTGLSADSSTRTFSVTWSELLPDLPSLTATFSDSSSSSTILGAPGTTDSASRSLNLLSNYRIDGWALTAFLNHQNFNVTLPSFLSPTNSSSESSGTAYGFTAGHALPLSGQFQAAYNRTNYSSGTGSYHNDGSTDSIESGVSFQPTQKFGIYGQARYTGNLVGTLQQSFLPGGTPPLPTNDLNSHAISLNTYGTYNLGRGFILIGYANRQSETFQGIDSTTTRAGGTLTYSYSRPLFGVLYFSFGMVNNATDSGGNSLGYVGNVALKKQLGRWQLDGDFSYAQNVQTIINSYTTSNYSYGSMIRRRFGANSSWTASYHGVQTGLTQLPGFNNRSDTFITILNRGRYAFSGSYAKSSGAAVLSSAGVLTPTPLAALIPPDEALYKGVSYGVGASVTPLRRMVINFNWYRTQSDTQTAAVFSMNNSERYYGQMQYNLRKLSFRAGYWRVYQGIGANGLPPTTRNTYYFNVSRWFNIF